jgi:anti-sigma regulatory factor (Ser/Thr protein kinase)
MIRYIKEVSRMPYDRGEEIRHYIVRQVEAHPADIARLAAEKFEVQPQSVRRHLRQMCAQNILIVEGQTRDRIYRLKSNVWRKSYPIVEGVSEDLAWNDAAPIVGKLPENVMSIWNTGFTEMFNNAIDHSGGTEITVAVHKTAINTEIEIRDNGVGIFKKIQMAANLPDERHAIIELSKGKFTTDRTKHTGEGIFFTSKMFDSFDILSGDLSFTNTRPPAGAAGTAVWMKLDNESIRTPADVYDAYSVDDFGFDKTEVPVKMAQFAGQRLVSRSQAKRVLARVGEFKVASFDFAGVEMIGQAFADEIFRVFRNAHPNIQLESINAVPEVARMIQRAMASGDENRPSPQRQA